MKTKLNYFFESFFRTYRFISRHPITSDNKFSAIKRVVKWQLASKFHPHPIIIPFVEETKLIVTRGMEGATGNLYAGLHEFEDMAFLLHFLREGDVFGDIGANIGAYTILASGVVKAKTVAAEPIPATFNFLQQNIKINNLEELVEVHNKGLGATEDTLRFTTHLDSVNHVVSTSEISNTIEVPIETLNKLFSRIPPTLLKIDVEGFEWEVLLGGESILSNPVLRAIIIELNGSGMRYGISDQQIHKLLVSHNFLPYKYDPFKRELIDRPVLTAGNNAIFIRDKDFVDQRTRQSKTYSVLGKVF